MDDRDDRRSLTDRQASAYIGMSQSWLRQSRMRGDPKAPPFVKLGRAVRYLRDDLDAWLESQRRTSTLEELSPVSSKDRSD